MKFRNLIVMLLAVLLLSGCSMAAAEEKLDAAEEKIDNRLDAAEDAVESMVHSAIVPTQTSPATTAPAAMLTKEQAEQIALSHVGLTADQVTRLRTEYEIDDGVPQYDVEFHEGGREYEFEIHAETGAMISFDRDYDT